MKFHRCMIGLYGMMMAFLDFGQNILLVLTKDTFKHKSIQQC